MAGMEDVPQALALIVAVIVVLTTGLHFVSRHNKKKDLKRKRSSPSSDANIPKDLKRKRPSPSSDSNIPRATSNFGHELHQLNESLFEFYKPPGQPNLQILFFHGFQFGNYDNAYISTWECKDKDGSSTTWPQTWLREEFPDAHIFSIAYNCHIKESRQYGQVDLFTLGENLMADLLEANIGQDRRCHVILVGHSFGGLVMKKLCFFAGTKVSSGSTEHRKFLENVKGLFFYSTPHGGIKRETIAPFFKSKSPLLENVEVLSTSTARLNDDFEKLRLFYKDWRIAGVGESSATKWDSYSSFIVVEEASSRYGDEFLIVPGSDHITISRPHNKKSTAFTAFTRLVHRVNQMRKVSGTIHLTHGLPEFPSGLEKRVEDLQNLLKTDPSQGTVVGIVGMGGLGKTTIAKQLFNDISSNYEYTCFVENVKDIPIYALEEKVLSQFCCDGASMKEGQRQWSYLEKKKTLIVMDDVSSVDQLKRVPKLDHFGIESQLIITSRDRSVLSDFHNCVVLYDVDFLTPAEGKELLCQQVFGAKTIAGHYHLAKWVDKVVQECGGLPLTLEVIGGYIRPCNNDVQFWKETVSNLEKAISVDGSKDDKVWASLKLSIDALNERERTAFIEAATCFFDRDLDEAFAAWSTYNAGVHTSWENLLRRSLVKNVQPWTSGKNYSQYTKIWVHENLRDLAKNISQRSSISTYDVHTFRRSCVHDTILMDLQTVPDSSRPPKTVPDSSRGFKSEATFWFESRDGRRGPDLDTRGVPQPLLNVDGDRAWVQLELFDHMENLKYLYLDNVLPEGLSNNFPQSISLLRWSLSPDYGYPKLPPICWKGMHNLSYLFLKGWEIPMELVEALGSVFKLRSLTLYDLVGADFGLGDIGNLSSLVQLTLQHVKLIALPDWLGDLDELVELRLRSLPILELPKSFGGLCFLIELSICYCYNLRDLTPSFGDLSSLESLNIINCENLRSLPESFGGLCSLASLDIALCENLRSLPESLGHLSCLKKLTLSYCRNLESLPASFGLLVGLQHLVMQNCHKLKGLPDDFGNLSSLTHLKLWHCSSLQELPASIGMLSSLEVFHLTGCEALQTLPDELSQLKALKKLTVSKSLFNNIGSLVSLTHLTLYDCGSIEKLLASIGMLSSLEEFDLSGCETLQRLPDEICQLKSLKKLTVSKAPRLQALPNNIGNLFSLTHLRLDECGSIEELPVSIGMLSFLEEFYLSGCETLHRLPDELWQLKALKKLTISKAPRLQALSSNLENLLSLTNLELDDCRSLEELPASIGMLSSLKEFRLSGCETLQRLPDELCQLKALKKLTISKASRLQALPNNFGNLLCLTRLRLDDCECLEELPASIGMLSCLEEFHLGGCETLQRLPDEFGQLKALKELTISKAPRLQAHSVLGNLSARLYLELDDWRFLEKLPADFEFLSEIESEGSQASHPNDLKNVVHRRISCRDCRMSPIKGDRYVSITEDDFDLCSNCFGKAGSQASYIRISHPPKPNRTQVCIIGFSLLNHRALTNLGWVLVDRRRGGCVYQRI